MAPPPSLATFEPVVRLDASARVCIVSDLHLGDGGPTDAFGRDDDRLRRFLGALASKHDALVVAGDGFDVAQAWSLARICEAHRRVVDDLLALARAMPVYYLRGNHEGSAAPLRRGLPLRYANELWIGERIRVEHGNAFDPYNLPGDRGAFRATRVHALIERAIRAPVRIPMRKHHAWSTRLGHWLFFRWGQCQRALARLDRLAGRDDRAARRDAFLDYWGRGEWGDAHGLLRAARAVLASEPIDVWICGHSHQPGVVSLEGGTYANTGTWTFGEATYAIVEDGRVVVRRWPDRTALGDEEYRGILHAERDRSFFDWWERYYRGWLRYDVEAMVRDAEGLGVFQGARR